MSDEVKYEWQSPSNALVIYDDKEIADISVEPDKTVDVSYGSFFGLLRTFRSLEHAKSWIEKHASDLADPDARSQL